MIVPSTATASAPVPAQIRLYVPIRRDISCGSASAATSASSTGQFSARSGT